jgi:ribonuclease BN (tRNA processing enzyme)
MSMRLTVLGRYGPFPAADGACSGYLVEADDICVLLDCGNGVISRLLTYKRLQDIDAVILTHLHSDHVSDMMVLRYAIDILKKRGQWNRLIKVYSPSLPASVWQDLQFNNVFELHDIKPGMETDIGGVKISLSPMVHPVPSFAVKLEDSAGHKLVYSGDTSQGDDLVGFAKGCDMLLCDGGLLASEKTSPNVPHLTAVEAGMVAACADAKAFLLTHLWFEHDEELYLKEARQHYPAAEVARERYTYNI